MNYNNIHPDTIASIRRYVDHHIEPSGFVMAVLCNDLRATLGRADPGNRAALHGIVGYCYNEIPWISSGSPERVRLWLAEKCTCGTCVDDRAIADTPT